MITRIVALFAVFAVSLGVMGLAGTAQAASPHFIRASATGVGDDGTVIVAFKLAGLGDNETIQISATAQATALYVCVNGGGEVPNDAKKQEVSGPVSATGFFTSGKNGQIIGVLILRPPASTLECPNGQTETFASVSYFGLLASAPGAGTLSLPGTFSRTFFEVD